MYYPDYLIHFNKNHSPKNGQFVSGDGDGDGIRDDHRNQSRAMKKYNKTSSKMIKDGAKNVVKGQKIITAGTLVAELSIDPIKKGVGYIAQTVGGYKLVRGGLESEIGLAYKIGDEIDNIKRNYIK